MIDSGCVASIMRMSIVIRKTDYFDPTWEWYALDLWT